MASFQLAGAGVALGLFYVLSKIIYNLYFHPLAKFPGPKYAAVSNIFYAFAWPGGRWPFILEDLHRKYGPVVRYASNDLDFATPQSYQDIHGHIKQGKQTFLKSGWYTSGPESTMGIVAQRDPAKHREVRKNLSHAFSAKALRTQTDVVLKYVGMWINQMKKHADNPQGVNVDEWYNWLTFDIIGDLAFGESFGAVENARGHPWVTTIKNSLYAGGFADVFRRVPLLKLFPTLVRPDNLPPQRKEHFRLSRERVERRMEMGNDREDFFAHLLSEKASDLTPAFLTAQANTLVVAGSETTATFLTGATFFLLKSPSTLHHLSQEIRSAFSDPGMINSDTTQNLPYLFAVIEEGLRMFPPIPAGLQRISPGAEVDGYYVPKGAIVSVSGWSNTHSEQHFHNARKFHPERWLPEDHPLYDQAYKNDVKDASKPFLVGPRACLGINLAYMEMRIILARLVWEFDWELISQDVDWERDTMLRVLWQKPELRVRFKPAVTVS